MVSLDRTAEFCIKEKEAFAELPMFNEAAEKLRVLVVEMRELNVLLDENTVGYTAAKNEAKVALLAKVMPVLRKVQAFASITEDEVLQNAVKYSRTKLIRMFQNLLGDTCRKVMEVSNEHMTDLAVYGLTAEMLEALEQAIVDFETKLVGTPLYIGQRKAAKQKLGTCMDEAMKLVRTRLDKLIELIKEDDRELYIKYKHARKPERAGSRKLSMKGMVRDSDTLQGIGRVMITVSRTDMPSKRRQGVMEQPVVVVQQLTALGGGFRIKSLEAGNYVITASKKGYDDATATFYINDSERTDIVLDMEANL